MNSSLRFAAIAVALTFTASASTLYVAPTGNDTTAQADDPGLPYKTVNAALTAAAAGDTVNIAAGTYKESKTWTIDKKLEIVGAGCDQTIISACKFKLNHAEAVISDLRVTGWSSQGAVEFVQNGAGGTMRRCDISGNTRTSTTGTGVLMYCGNLIDCVITNNVNGTGGNGVGINISASGDCLLENCLIADNMVGGATSGVGGLYITSSVNGKRVVLRHCTIVGNSGGDVGGLSVNGNVNFEMTDCLVADNFKLKAASASNTADAYLGWSGGYTRGVTNCLIAKCPTYNAGYQVENCITNIAAGLNQPYAGDYSVGRGSAAWGAAADGTDIGFYQTEHGEAFAVGCYAETDRGIGSVTTVLHGTAVNASGAVTYEWDLDGDGTYEKSGATVEAAFTEIGWNGVNVKATCGGESVAATVEHVVCVFAPTTYCWTKSPNPTFPYATWETAATDPYAALAATIDGGKLQFTNEMVLLTKPMQVTRRIEMCGTGKENNSVNSSPLYWTSLKNFEDVNATGTSIQRKGASDVILLRLFNEGATVHSIAYGPGRSRDLEIFGESVVSNCTVRYGSYTAGDGCGVWMNAGLVTHCVISNNYCSNDSTKGVQLHMEGTAKLRNSLVVNGRADSAGSNGGCKGAIWASGSNVQIENCTICGNTAGKGGGVYTVGAVTVRNCIIRDNSAMLTDNDIYVESGTPVFENCCLAESRGTGCQTGQPGFILDEAGKSTWTFSAASPCVNNGVPVGWATEDATDYFGNKRVQGDGIDIGCFEADLSQATCDIEVSASEIVGGAADVTFSVKLVGATLPEDAVCKWDFDGDGVYEREGASVTLHCEEGYHTASLKVMKDDETLYEAKGKSDLVTVFPTVIYFNGANAEGAAFPYNTPAKAASKMSDVLAAAKSGVDIRVCEGVHDCDVQILLNFKCTFHAAEGVTARPRLVRKFDGNSFVSVAHDEALIEGLDLDDNKYYTFNVNLNDGTIRDCVIRNGYYTSGSGIGLTMSGGLVDRCEIVGIRGTSEQSYSGRGLALHLSGSAVVRNSLIHGNFAEDSVKGRRGGLISVEGNAVLESCTVTDNTNRQENVICTFGTGTVRNCIVFGNECGQNNVTGSPYFPSYAPMVSGDVKLVGEGVKTADFDYNCYTSVTAMAYGEHDVLGDPRFSTKGLPYSLAKDSPCLDKGQPEEWMQESGALDFAGGSRLVRCLPDIGCIEFVPAQTTYLILR